MMKITHVTYDVAKLLNLYCNSKLIVNDSKESSIVEAALMGLPINVICQQQLGGTMKMIFGNFKSIIDFHDNKTPLKNCKFYPQLEGKFFNELDNLYANILLDTKIHVVKVMHNVKPEDVKNLIYVMQSA